MSIVFFLLLIPSTFIFTAHRVYSSYYFTAFSLLFLQAYAFPSAFTAFFPAFPAGIRVSAQNMDFLAGILVFFAKSYLKNHSAGHF